MAKNVFPQDQATGLSDTADWDDAGAFAHHRDSINDRDYVVSGLEPTVDWATGTLNISAGVAQIWQSEVETNDHSGDGGPTPKVLQGALFTVDTDPSGDLGLTDGATNHVFLGVNQQQNNDYIWQVNTDNTAPPEPFLKLFTIDMNAESVDKLNRAPTGTFRELTVK